MKCENGNYFHTSFYMLFSVFFKKDDTLLEDNFTLKQWSVELSNISTDHYLYLFVNAPTCLLMTMNQDGLSSYGVRESAPKPYRLFHGTHSHCI